MVFTETFLLSVLGSEKMFCVYLSGDILAPHVPKPSPFFFKLTEALPPWFVPFPPRVLPFFL